MISSPFSNLAVSASRSMRAVTITVLALVAMIIATAEAGEVSEPVASLPPYITWTMADLAVEQPLGGLKGDPVRGRYLVVAPKKGNCLACHKLPIPEEPFHGTVGPSLHHIARQLSEGEIRLSIIDQRQIEPDTIMPGYYRDPALPQQVLKDFRGRTILTAQEIEDVVAFLMTLK